MKLPCPESGPAKMAAAILKARKSGASQSQVKHQLWSERQKAKK